MLKHILSAGVVAGLLAVAEPLSAQNPIRPARLLDVTPYAGYMMFGDMFDGPLGTTLSNANGPLYGAQLGVRITPNLSVIGNVGYASSDLKVGVPFLSDLSIGSSSVLLYDAGLQYSVPLGPASVLPITPFVQVGAGAMRYDVKNRLLETDATNFAFNAGVGADVALGPNLGLRVMAKDYMGKVDVEQATNLDAEGNFAHNWALSAGLKISF